MIPAPLGTVLGHLPAFPGSLMFVTGLNLALAKQLSADVTHMLTGKKLRLCVTDAHWAFDFAWKADRFVACYNPGSADLTISASVFDFVQLARRQEDPDTLFFNRRLAMEGDTELGLLVKNTLDGMELPVFNPTQLKPAHMLAQAREHFKARLGSLLPRV